MALDLGSARLNVTPKGAPTPPVQQVKPARTSIAEDAIFIPKPHKRVEFKLNTPGGSGELSAAGKTESKSSVKPIPLPGEASDNGGGDLKPIGSQNNNVTGQNITAGNLGQHGLTAEFGKDSYSAPKQLVKTEYKAVPQKDFSVIATQEEGRQTNHAKQVHFTQQYDAYGRPRIGFSREPYDFAATKYVSKTSEIKFQQNMASTREAYSKYTDTGTATQPPAQQAAGKNNTAQSTVQAGMIDPEAVKGTKGLIDPKESAKKFIGADKAPKAGMVDYNPKEVNTLGDSAKMKEGLIDTSKTGAPAAANAPDPKEMIMKGESALTVAEKMGITANAVMTPTTAAPNTSGAYSVGGQNPLATFPVTGTMGAGKIDAGLGGKSASDVAALMGANISAVLTTQPEKVADFHAASQLLKSNAAISVSA